MTKGLLYSLYAIRGQVDAAIAQVQDAMGITADGAEPGSCPQCKAPPEMVKDDSRMDGTKRSRCVNCGHEWERT